MSDHVPTPDEEAMAQAAGLEIQPAPVSNDLPSVHDLVIRDLMERGTYYGTHDDLTDEVRDIYDQVLRAYTCIATLVHGGESGSIQQVAARKEFGLKKYGTLLQPFNGRNALADALDEIGDLAAYLRTYIYEKENPR